MVRQGWPVALVRQMKAQEAMARAWVAAEAGDVELGMLWVDIARELREGSTAEPGPERTMPIKAIQTPDSDATAVMNDSRCVHCGYYLAQGGLGLIHVRTGQAVCPVGKPGPGDTVIHTYAELSASA